MESLRPGLSHSGDGHAITRWHETIAGEVVPELTALDGMVAAWRYGKIRYLATWPEPGLAGQIFSRAAGDAGLAPVELPEGLRLRRTARHCFVFNYANYAIDLSAELPGLPVIGERILPPAGVTVLG